MLVYNTTYTIDPPVQHEWLYWVKTEYLPAIMETGLPRQCRVLRLKTDVGQQGVILSVQLDFSTADDYGLYLTTAADVFYERMQFRFGDKTVSFSTVLEEIWTYTAG